MKRYAAELPIETALAPVMDRDNHFCDDPETMLYISWSSTVSISVPGWFNSLEIELNARMVILRLHHD